MCKRPAISVHVNVYVYRQTRGDMTNIMSIIYQHILLHVLDVLREVVEDAVEVVLLHAVLMQYTLHEHHTCVWVLMKLRNKMYTMGSHRADSSIKCGDMVTNALRTVGVHVRGCSSLWGSLHGSGRPFRNNLHGAGKPFFETLPSDLDDGFF